MKPTVARSLSNVSLQIDRFRARTDKAPLELQCRVNDVEVILRVQPIYRNGIVRWRAAERGRRERAWSNRVVKPRPPIRPRAGSWPT